MDRLKTKRLMANFQGTIAKISKKRKPNFKNLLNQVKGFTPSMDLDKITDEILKIDNGTATLAIDRNVVKRIIRWLHSEKNVILVGAPGVGKTRLARRILDVEGKRFTGKKAKEVVAHYEWTRRSTIGGMNPASTKFESGHITAAAEEGRWLLIDEFNRADINKAFGEMFLAIESKKITLSPEEEKARVAEGKTGKIKIPPEFRIIGTMNDFDKNLLLTELSYGLITRFVFVDIKPDDNTEQASVKDQILQGGNVPEINYKSCQEKINKFYEFIKAVRPKRMIGVRTCIDVIRYVVTAHQRNKSDIDNFLDEALCDCLLPQFDRLDKPVISATITAAENHIPEAYRFVDGLKEMKIKLDEATSWMTKKVENSESDGADGTTEKPRGKKRTLNMTKEEKSARGKKAARTRKRNAAANARKRKGR